MGKFSFMDLSVLIYKGNETYLMIPQVLYSFLIMI